MYVSIVYSFQAKVNLRKAVGIIVYYTRVCQVFSPKIASLFILRKVVFHDILGFQLFLEFWLYVDRAAVSGTSTDLLKMSAFHEVH